MSVVAKFQGGPRSGRKNTLKNFNEAPKTIPVPVKETKAVNMPSGRYIFNGTELHAKGVYHLYSWQRTG